MDNILTVPIHLKMTLTARETAEGIHNPHLAGIPGHCGEYPKDRLGQTDLCTAKRDH